MCDDDLVERVASAILKAVVGDDAVAWEEMEEYERADYRREARAAIAAIEAAGYVVVPREAMIQARAAMLRTRTASIAGCDEGYGKPEKWADELFSSHGDLTASIKNIDGLLGMIDAALEKDKANVG